MNEEEIEKMWKELAELRKSQRSKTLTSIRPTESSSILLNTDFASLYPSTMKMHFPSRQSRRKKKIKNIFT
jgi:hypothetical protein